MTFYLRISPLNNPQDFGVDTVGRSTWSFDVIATKRLSVTTLEEILSLVAELVSYGRAVCGSKASIPDGDEPSITMLSLGGAGTIFNHNESIPDVKDGIRITVRAKKSRDARDVAFRAFTTLIKITNTEVTPVVIPAT
jgi:hypothetical protein